MNLHLTFDDGPTAQWTPKLLDLLAEYGVKATFFVVGASVLDNPEVIGRIAREYHTIGNHTFTHSRLTALTDNQIRCELLATQYLIDAWPREHLGVWRAPYFGIDDRVKAIALEPELNLEHVGADIVPEDCFTNDALLIAERVIEGARNSEAANPVVCLHDGIPPDGGSASCTQSRQPTVDAVRIILETLA